MRRTIDPFVLTAAGLLAAVAALPAQEKSLRPDINKSFENPDLKKYLETFEGESREIFTHRRDIVAACNLKPRMKVADVGAGTGLFTRLFAKEVGPEGSVVAVDVAANFLDHVKKSAAEQGLKNVTTVQCSQTSTELPPNSVDLVFICDTYHHFEFPFRTMASIHRALRPGGQVVLIDFHRIPGKTREWILGHVRAGQDVVVREVEGCGFKLVEERDFLKENYFVRFARTEDADARTPAFVYKKTKQAELSLHASYPKDWRPGDRRPAVVFFFGGGWTNGNVKQFEPQAAYLAGRGMVALRADYRVKSRHGVTPVDCVEDARSAVRWVRRNAARLGVDPDRIVAAGGSAGGHLAACTALADGPDAAGEDRTVSTRPAALLLFNPVLRFDGVPQLEERVGGDAKAAKLLSPTLHLTKDSPPAVLFYGTDDRLLAQGEEYVARAKEVGVRAELMKADGVGHGFFNRPPWRDRTLRRADEFLTSLGYLQGPPAVPDK
jgi:acetyl esterase